MKKKTLLAVLCIVLAGAMLFAFASCGGTGTGTTTAAPEGGDTVVEDLAYVTGKGELIIGITYYEPMNYLDDNNELTGFETEFAKAVCEKLGVTAKFQEINWSAKETELNAKNIDCIWNGMTIDEDRKTNMSISVPYMANKQVLVVKADKADLTSVDGLTVVAEKESAGETVATSDAFFEKANYTAVDTQAKALMEVASGTADACVVDYVCSIGMIGEGTDYANLKVLESQAFNNEEYGIAFRKGSDLTAKVNEAIQALADDGTLATLAEKYNLSEQLLVKPAA